MTETRESLEARKREVFDAIRLLEQDHRDGVMETAAYETARQRYEMEAAQILERLDQLPADEKVPRKPRVALWGVAGGVVLVLAALALFLVPSLQQRTTTAVQPTPATTSALTLAQRNVARHPNDPDALLALGNAYLDLGDTARADGEYRMVMKVAPARPEGKTLHAMMLSANGKSVQALGLLSQVERDHPTFARAWLLDGLIASKMPKGETRAIAAWKRFLALDPNSALSPSVRKWLAQLEKGTPKR